MFNLSKESMRKLVKFTSGMFMNSKCPLWLQRKGLNFLGGYSILPKSIKISKQILANKPVWWFNFEDKQSRTVILYFHGGGYGIGSPKSHRDLCGHLALYSQMSVASLAYSLAPENPYPAAINDAYAAYHELLEQGYNTDQIVVAGDSAGGGLALSLAVKLKQHNVQQPAGLFLISPSINYSQETASHITQLNVDPVINEAWAKQMSFNYLKESEELINQACLANQDFSGIAPMLIHVGTDEVLLDDSLMLKQHALVAGVHVTLVTYPELWHVFHFSPSLFKPAKLALKDAAQFITGCFK